ncbi:MAG: excalibur calcium-binding domain-containing protein [Rhodoferax sp.]|nr:excalibur calcium-binding domain-containing protein [Rhodoferax sp.]
MVAEGHAWSLRTKWDRGPYVAQERMARSLDRGLHAAGGAIAPAEFRRRNGPCGLRGSEGDTGAPEAMREAGASPAAAAKAATAAPTPGASAASALRCDGRTRCSQMRSCEEATWFLRHCPGVRMDGNGDGVPCERQWCGR